MSRRITLYVNGIEREVAVRPDESLLMLLRNQLELTGPRYGCGLEQCGACMVLVDGVPAYSCTADPVDCSNRSITTVEGLSPGADRLHPLQEAFLAEQAGQCGYCLSGIIVSAKALLDRNKSPTRAEIAEALDKHLCRCGTHNRIIAAVQRAAAEMGVE